LLFVIMLFFSLFPIGMFVLVTMARLSASLFYSE
jgi:hypothetical protein